MITDEEGREWLAKVSFYKSLVPGNITVYAENMPEIDKFEFARLLRNVADNMERTGVEVKKNRLRLVK